MADDFLSFLPVTEEDADSVRARFDSDANAGLGPTDPGFLDTTVGGFYWDLTQPCVLECVRLWDLLGTEVVAAAFPGTAWGDYLDSHGETVGLLRRDEAASRGIVLFVGNFGLLIPEGTEVATVQPDPSAQTDPVVFTTDVSISLAAVPGPANLVGVSGPAGGALLPDSYCYVVTAINPAGQETVASNEVILVVSGTTSKIDLSWTAFPGATAYKIYRSKIAGAETLLAQIGAAAKPAPTGLTATPTAGGGTLAAGNRFYVVTALDATGETVKSSEVTATAVLNGKVTLTWNKVEGASKYRVYEGGSAGAENTYWEVTTNSYVNTTPTGTAGSPPVANTTTGTTFSDTGVDTPTPAPAPTNTVSVTAEVAGSVGNVPAGTITQILSPLSPPPTVTNPASTTAGADVESDDRFRQRILAEYEKAAGAGNVSDYVNLALAIPEIGFVTVQPIWNGAGTVRLIITDQQNHTLPASVVTSVQNMLDPVPQQGAGLAPIGANVTVVTPTGLPVVVAAKIVFDPNYSLDGAAGTIPTRVAIQAALDAYLTTLPPGTNVILTAIVRQIMSVPGVIDVQGPSGTGLPTLNGTAANVAVAGLQVAQPGGYTLTV